MGYVLPPVRVTDNTNLKGREYQFLIKGGGADHFDLMPGCDLAIPTPKARPIEGHTTRDPAFGLKAVWVPSDRAEAARAAGYTVVDGLNVLGTHFTEMIRRHVHEIYSRQDAKSLCDRVAQESPKVVEDLVPKLLSYAAVQRVLQNLLREGVPIRDGLSILEALGEAAVTSRNPILLSEYVRQSIRRTLVKPYLGPNGELRCWFLEPGLEHMVESAVQHGEQNSVLTLAPDSIRDIVKRFQAKIDRPEIPAVILAGAGARYFLRQMVEPTLWNAAILSHNEVPPGIKVVSLGTIQ
jgi:flagellar biosynthesis protein FlhA